MKQNIFIFIGPPGSGKGSLSQLCVQRLGFKQLSTGALCRKHIAQGTSIGQEIDFAIKSGKLIADSLILAMVTQWLDELHADVENIILDGFPRTVSQAQALQRLIEEDFEHCNLSVVEFTISDAEAINRLAGRFVCKDKECQAVYSAHSHDLAPKKEMACDVCDQALVRRSDDTPETVKQRLATHYQHTQPLLNYYRQAGQPITSVDVHKSLDSVFDDFIKTIEIPSVNTYEGISSS